MEIEFSKGGSANYTQILESIRKNQSVVNGKMRPASLAKVASDLTLTVREVRQALQRFRKKYPDYKREKMGSIVLKDGSKLAWNAHAEPIEYCIIDAVKPTTPKAKPTTPPKKGK